PAGEAGARARGGGDPLLRYRHGRRGGRRAAPGRPVDRGVRGAHPGWRGGGLDRRAHQHADRSGHAGRPWPAGLPVVGRARLTQEATTSAGSVGTSRIRRSGEQSTNTGPSRTPTDPTHSVGRMPISSPSAPPTNPPNGSEPHTPNRTLA